MRKEQARIKLTLSLLEIVKCTVEGARWRTIRALLKYALDIVEPLAEKEEPL